MPVPISIAHGDALDIGSGQLPSPGFGAIAPDVPPVEGPPVGAGPVDVGDGLFTYRQLLTLPPGGMAALALIDQAWTALRRRYGRVLLRWHSPGAKVIAADLAPIPEQARALQELPVIAHLDAGPIPVRVRLALLGHRAAWRDPRRSSARRDGVASAPHWQPVSFTFDSQTGELVTGRPINGGYPDVSGPASRGRPGRGRLDHRAPQRSRADPRCWPATAWPSPLAPQAELVSPGVGGAHSVFTVLVAAAPGEHAHPAPTAWLGIIGSAGQGVYHAGEPAFNRRGLFLPGNQGADHACKRPRAGVGGDDNPPRRPSRVRVPRRVAAVPPPGLVPRPLPARDSDVPESASAALHDAVLHRADRDDRSTSRSHSGTGLPPIPRRPSRGSTHGSPGTSAFTNVGPRHWRAAVELGLPLAAGRKQKQK